MRKLEDFNKEIPIIWKISNLLKINKKGISIKEYNDLSKAITTLEIYYNGMYVDNVNESLKYAKKYLILLQLLGTKNRVNIDKIIINEAKELKEKIEDIRNSNSINRTTKQKRYDIFSIIEKNYYN